MSYNGPLEEKQFFRVHLTAGDQMYPAWVQLMAIRGHMVTYLVHLDAGKTGGKAKVAEVWLRDKIIAGPYNEIPKAEPAPKKYFVIMANDFPEGVMDDEVAAEAIVKARNEADKANEPEKRRMGQGRIYSRSYPFTLNEVGQ